MMRSPKQRAWSRRGLFAAAVIALAFALGSVFGVGRSALYLARLSEFPSADAAGSSVQSRHSETLHFRFRGRTRFVRAAVDPIELEAARALDTSVVFSTVGPVRSANISALVSAQSRSATVESIVGELGRIRDDLGLDGDEYVELIARFVQEIPYGVPDTEVHLPVEVVVMRTGVCDDKSVLLAALLVHEGYDTAIWAFDAQAHAAVGIRCSGPGTIGSGYALIETTRVAYVGDATGSLGTRAAWRRNPHLVRLGGSRAYGSDREAAFLVETLQRAESTVASLDPYVKALATGPAHWRAAYAQMAQRRSDSERLAQQIALSMDDRRRVYESLAYKGGR